jgi:hypothetical protein
MPRQVIKREVDDFDSLYSGAGKINDNFEEVYTAISSLEISGELQPDNVDFTYHSLLMSSSFNSCYFDIFREEGTVSLGGFSDPVHDLEGQYYSGYSGSELYTQVASAAPSGSSSFYVYLDIDEALPFDTYYSINGVDWIECSEEVANDEIVYTSSSFDDLWFKFVWGGTGNIYSFGVLYDYSGFTFISKTRFLTTYVAPSGIPSGTIFDIPEDNSYTQDGKSLDIFKNGLRLAEGLDYEETSRTSITWLVDIESDDVITFTEQFGYVDSSDDNKSLILEEHDISGNHTLKDKIFTSDKFALNLVGSEPLVVDIDNPEYTLSYSITRDGSDNVTSITEESSLGTKISTYSYDIDGNLEIETVTLNGSTVRVTTYTYTDGDLVSWETIYSVV